METNKVKFEGDWSHWMRSLVLHVPLQVMKLLHRYLWPKTHQFTHQKKLKISFLQHCKSQCVKADAAVNNCHDRWVTKQRLWTLWHKLNYTRVSIQSTDLLLRQAFSSSCSKEAVFWRKLTCTNTIQKDENISSHWLLLSIFMREDWNRLKVEKVRRLLGFGAAGVGKKSSIVESRGQDSRSRGVRR